MAESLTRLGRVVRDGTERAASGVELLGRLGYAVKGVVYLLVGALAAEAAVGAGGAMTGSRGAMRQVLRLPLGEVLLMAIGVGLGGYALWRVVQAFMDTDHRGKTAKGIAMRAGSLLIGLLHAGLAWSAVELARGHRSRGDEASSRAHTAWLLSLPFGSWLVGLVGTGVIGFGLYELSQAITARFADRLRPMDGTTRTWTVRLGRFGHAARGVVFVIIGGFLVSAGIHGNPRDTRGLGGALEVLARQPAGVWLFGTVAVGLAAYGVFMLLEARFRRIVVH